MEQQEFKRWLSGYTPPGSGHMEPIPSIHDTTDPVLMFLLTMGKYRGALVVRVSSDL